MRLCLSWLGKDVAEEERLEGSGEGGGPTLTMREPNSTPMVTSCYENYGSASLLRDWIRDLGNGRLLGLSSNLRFCSAGSEDLLTWGEKRPSQSLMVRLDFPVPESPIQTSLAM